MASDADFYVKFWGVRGSIACPGERYIRYGGNTPCLEVRCGRRLLILDAGTGLRELGLEMMRNSELSAELFLTHTHFDHIAGLPFFVPLFKPEVSLGVWAGHLMPYYTVNHVVREMMMAPLFPVPPEIFRAQIEYHDFRAGESLQPSDGIVIRTAQLNHPNGATGYRIDYEGKSICLVTDTEHYEDRLDDAVLRLAEGADVMIYDATYTDAEYPKYKGFGHSTWQEGVKVGRAAGVKRYITFHHDPSHDDDTMDRIAADLDAHWPGSLVAREGLVVAP